jgi:hypothetical protein
MHLETYIFFTFLVEGKDEMDRYYFKKISNNDVTLSILNLICKHWYS